MTIGFVALYIFIYFQGSAWTCTKLCNTPSPWINQATNICYGAKNDSFAAFKMSQVCQVVAIRLEHVSGRVRCKDDSWSRWGCKGKYCPKCLKTIVVKNGKLWLPKTITAYGRFGLDGFKMNDDVLIFKKDGKLDKGEELQVWYGEDFMKFSESDNGGIHCINVDVSCLF